MRKGLFIWLVFVLLSCEKDPEIPVGKGSFVDVGTSAVTGIQDTRANSGISISNLTGNYIVQERGICWGINQNPSIDNLSYRASSNAESMVLYDLIPGQKYYVRAYAKINGVYTYGNQREFTSTTASNMTSGLVTYLPLNEDSKDYSSSGNNLTGNAVKTISRNGVINGAFAFNGANQYLTLLSPKNLPENNNAYSFSFWFKANVWNREMAIFGYGPSGTIAASNYVKVMPSGGLLHYHWSLDNQFTSAFFTGLWTHLVVTYDGSTERYYINGQPQRNWLHPTSPLFVKPSILSLGARVVTLSTNDIKEYFNGAIDDVRIYNRSLSQLEASILFSL